MKIWWNRKYSTIAVYAFLVIAASVLFVFAVVNFHVFWRFLGRLVKVLEPFIIGFVIAYLLNPGYQFIRVKIFGRIFEKKPMPRLSKVLSVASIYIFSLGLLVFLLWIVIPQVLDSTKEFLSHWKSYYESLDKLIIQYSYGNANISDIGKAGAKALDDYFKAFDFTTLSQTVGIIMKFTSGISSFLVGIVISIYMLYSKERFGAQLRKIGLALLPERYFKRIESIFGKSHTSFGKYIAGKLLDALVIGILCFIVMTLVDMPYAVLISVLIGVSNIVPFFGPIVGVSASTLLVLMVKPDMAIWALLIIIILQQIDGNFIDPRIVGIKTGLLPFWVIFAVLVGGGFFGVIGIIVAVPFFSVFYSITKNFIEQRLRKKEMSPNTWDYKPERKDCSE
ncbi:MAG: hypothetical protein BGN88_04150 [Clostridiales bacterium 43-6]|nr:MAG: hypothetical protein BGN88_04150 [Clostridiales bacterium 43-6]